MSATSTIRRSESALPTGARFFARAKALACLTAALLATSAAAVHAGEPAPSQKPGAESPLSPDWIVTAQIGPGLTPIFPGAGRMRAAPIPGFDFRRVGEPERFSAADDGFGFSLFDSNGLRAGPVANFAPPRHPRFPDMFGLRRIEIAVEVGGFAEYFVADKLRLRSELRHGVHGHGGWVGNIGADLIERSGPMQLSIGPRLNFGSDRYARAYYSVAPWQAALNGRLPAYHATGGLTSAGLFSSVRYDLTPEWNATLYAGVHRLTGSAGASPIPRLLGARTQTSVGLLFARSFRVSGF